MTSTAKKERQLFRVRKADVQPINSAKPDGLNVCLECWRLWMDCDDKGLSASRMKLAAGEPSDGFDRDVYAEQRTADLAIGEATGAMIDSLRPHLRWAIYRQCGVTTLWNFPLLDFLTVATEAMQELENKLKKNIATATLFVA